MLLTKLLYSEKMYSDSMLQVMSQDLTNLKPLFQLHDSIFGLFVALAPCQH